MLKAKMNINWIKTKNKVSFTLYGCVQFILLFGLLVTLWKYKLTNAPPQVFSSINEADGPELRKTSLVLHALY